jgi:hypothetical protein
MRRERHFLVCMYVENFFIRKGKKKVGGRERELQKVRRDRVSRFDDSIVCLESDMIVFSSSSSSSSSLSKDRKSKKGMGWVEHMQCC